MSDDNGVRLRVELEHMSVGLIRHLEGMQKTIKKMVKEKVNVSYLAMVIDVETNRLAKLHIQNAIETQVSSTIKESIRNNKKFRAKVAKMVDESFDKD